MLLLAVLLAPAAYAGDGPVSPETDAPAFAQEALPYEGGAADGQGEQDKQDVQDAQNAQDEQEGAALPEEWEKITREAPMTRDEFLSMTFADWVSRAGETLRSGARAPLQLLLRLCGVLLVAAVGRGLCAGNTSPELAGLVDMAAALAVFAACAPQLLSLTDVMRQAVESCRTYMIAFVPVFVSVLTACGQPGGAALYGGLFFTAATVAADVLCRVGLPAIRMLLAMHAAGAASDTPVLTRVSAALGRWVNWLLALFATVFGALVALQSVFAQSADTLALRTGKFVIGSAVPVVGHAVSDAMGSVLAGMKLIKGTVGFAAVAVVIAAFVPVLATCGVFHMALTLAGAAAEALGEERSARLLTGLAGSVSLYLSIGFSYLLLLTVGTLVMVLLGNGG